MPKRVSQGVGQSQKLEGLKVSLRAIFRASKVRLGVMLGPNLRARAT